MNPSSINEALIQSALSAIYMSMHLVDINENTVSVIKTKPDIEALRNSCVSSKASDQLIHVMSEIALPSYTVVVKDFCDFDTLKDRLFGKNTISIEFKSSNRHWYRARFLPIELGMDGNAAKAVFAVEPITEEKERDNTLRRISETDPLTALRNHESGEALTAELIRRGVYGMFCILHVDSLNAITKTAGPEAKDNLILAISECLNKAFRDNDIIFRLNDEKFAIYLPEVESEEIGRLIIKRLFNLIAAIEIPMLREKKMIPTVSVGASICLASEELDYETLFDRVSQGTIKSRKLPGNAFCFV